MASNPVFRKFVEISHSLPHIQLYHLMITTLTKPFSWTARKEDFKSVEA
jgi:hypothetical protein